MKFKQLAEYDPKVHELVKKEEKRQETVLEMIASENFTIPAVREPLASAFVHKYAEGEINNRYYQGNQVVDELNQLCKDRAREVFKLPKSWGVNVQPYSGSAANLGVYNGILEPGDTILSMYLPDGGHLSHGWSYPSKDQGLEAEAEKQVYLGGDRKINIVSKLFNTVQYKVDPETKIFDYDNIARIAKKYKPDLIVSGGTAYPREINHRRLAEIAGENGAYYMADIAHEAGLVAVGVNQSPVGIADVVTFTTHKTLRGPRGALILSQGELSKRIDSGIFPGLQGGPHENSIAGITVCLKAAGEQKFQAYAEQTVRNAKVLARELIDRGYEVVSGGTDKHLVLVDLRNKGISGDKAAKALEMARIVANKNTVPQETGSSKYPSGIRLGTSAITSRGVGEKEIKQIAGWIDEVMEIISPLGELEEEEFIKQVMNSTQIKEIAEQVKKCCMGLSKPSQ